jgi:DNA mismatch repair ATPase MutS
VSKIQDTFHQYHFLLGLLEQEKFSSEILKKNQSLIHSEKKKASAIFKEFSKAIDDLDQRNNMLFGIFANGFLLWDLRQSYKLEKWISAYRQNVKKWFEVIEFTDAYNSLGNFVFNHPAYVFPKIINEKGGISTTKLAHPLLDPKKRIANDFAIDDEEFFIITGANMAGKSTFLRTVSLQIVMSNIGLPVCAEACSYSPIKLITSMRTSDSLSDDESYFFSELKRLKFIVDEIKTDRYFIILDEILKGTNSSDKAIGSKKFIRKLVNSNSTGIIATHDLSLCEITSELSQVKNHYFDAEIINDELYFDYKFKDGICQNMNASFLLRKMEIVDD